MLGGSWVRLVSCFAAKPLSCSPVYTKNLKDLPRLEAKVFETEDTELFEEILECRIPLFDFEKGRISNHFVSTRDSSFAPWRRGNAGVDLVPV